MSRNSSEIARSTLERLKKALGYETDEPLAARLGVAQNTLSTWRKRGIGDYEAILAICDDEGLSLDWILAGREAKGGPARGTQFAEIHRELELRVREVETLYNVIERISSSKAPLAAGFTETAEKEEAEEKGEG